MDIYAPKKTLLAALERAQHASDPKSAVPVLANALLLAEGGTLSVTATDLYRAASTTLDVEVSRAGSIAVPAKDTCERVKAMPDGPVQITADGTTVLIRAVGKKRGYTVHGLPAQDFPMLPQPTDATWTVIAASLLLRLLSAVHKMISTDETRAHVNSALLSGDGITLRAVATDGHRLGLVAAAATLAGEHLVPLAAVHDLRRLLGDLAEVEIAIVGPCLFLRAPGLLWSTKLVDATFPPWEQVVPKREKFATVNRAALAEAVKAVGVAASDKTGGMVFSLGAVLSVTAESAETGSAHDEVAADWGGEPCKVGLNGKYVLDALDAITTDDVRISVLGELDPVLVLPSEGDDTFVCMPMRI